MPNDLDVHPREVLHNHCNEVRVVAAEVVKEDRDLAGASMADVAPFVRRTLIHPSDVVVISHSVGAVEVEGLAADVTHCLQVPNTN